MPPIEQRYRFDRYRSACLAGNPVGSPAERPLGVYLPPGYEDDPARRYPVVYLLHGYGQDGRHPMVGPRAALRRSVPLPLRWLLRGLVNRLLVFETLDELITAGRLPPFILVQPDASLHLPHRYGFRQLDGETVTRGSMYTDSPWTGRFHGYVFEEVVGLVDTRYRTLAERRGRALVGGSMGGYGALLAGILHPDRFGAVAALSPAIGFLELLDRELIAPYHRMLLGERWARRRGRRTLHDILDTCDLVFSADRPLLPTVRRDAAGRANGMDPTARDRWAAADLARMVAGVPGALRDVRLKIDCGEDDEYGFAAGVRRFHETLVGLDIAHEVEVYRDPAARWSPHTLGIAGRILPGIRFCLAALTAVPAR